MAVGILVKLHSAQSYKTAEASTNMLLGALLLIAACTATYALVV